MQNFALSKKKNSFEFSNVLILRFFLCVCTRYMTEAQRQQSGNKPLLIVKLIEARGLKVKKRKKK